MFKFRVICWKQAGHTELKMFLFNSKGLLFKLLYKDWYGLGNNFLQMDFKIWISVLKP